MQAEIVVIGTEILMGELVDTNSSRLASGLARLGIELRWVTKVGDDPDQLAEVLEQAWHRSDVTLTTGGLGPTSDDLTRETIARVLCEEMVVQDDLLVRLKSFFEGRGTSMPENNIKQATLIPSAEAIENPLGTAPGWWVERDGRIIVAIPGPPGELERMWTREVAPRLRQRNSDVAIITRTLKTFGLSEGGINEMIVPLFGTENPYLGIYSKTDGIHLRLIARAPTEEEARRLIEPVESKIRDAVGDAIWGEDDERAESILASRLLEQGKTVAIMECYTGGLLTSRLTDNHMADDFLKGGIVVRRPDELERYGLDQRVIIESGPVSVKVAEAMAGTALSSFGADVGIGVTAIEADFDSGWGSCYFGYAMNGRTYSAPGRYNAQRFKMRGRAVTQAILGLVQLMSERDRTD